MPEAQDTWFKAGAAINSTCTKLYSYPETDVLQSIDKGASNRVTKLNISDIVEVNRVGCEVFATLSTGTRVFLLRATNTDDAVKKFRSIVNLVIPGMLTSDACI
jgi:hypothetical protein